MNAEGEKQEFEIKAEVAPLYDVSFILCGFLFCRSCKSGAPEDTGAPPYSDLHYYRVAELAHHQGWIPDPAGDYDVLCPACVAQQTLGAD